MSQYQRLQQAVDDHLIDWLSNGFKRLIDDMLAKGVNPLQIVGVIRRVAKREGSDGTTERAVTAYLERKRVEAN